MNILSRYIRRFSFLAGVISICFTSALSAATPVASAATTSTGTTKAAGVPYKFEILAPTVAYTNEAIDVTVRVVDKDGNVVPTYRGTILFNSTDLKAELPYQSLGYQFRTEDRGEKVFSKGVNFKNVGSFNLDVSDITDDIVGSVDVKVEARQTSIASGSSDTVTILTPENNSTQVTKDITITGKTRKNSKVGIFLNGTDAGNVISDTDGSFVKTASNLTEKNYILQAKLYDASNAVVATSPEIKFSLANDLPVFFGITMAEGNSVSAESTLNILVDADPSLTSVSINLDGSVIPLLESQPGKYTTKIAAPAKAGTYPIDVTLTNTLSQKTEKSKVVSLTVTEKSVILPKFQNVKAQTEGTGGKVTFSFTLDTPPADLGSFKILYGDSPASLTGEVKTLGATAIKNQNGLYTWYIPNLPAKKWYFKILPLDTSDKVIANISSDIIDVTVGTSVCTIANVTGLMTDTQANKSILKWESVPTAASYNIYKKNTDGTMTLIQNVKDTSYVIYLSSGSLAYTDFGVKALCADGKTESPDATLASKVQTGPGLLLFLGVISCLVGLFIIRKEYFMMGR